MLTRFIVWELIPVSFLDPCLMHLESHDQFLRECVKKEMAVSRKKNPGGEQQSVTNYR